MSFFPHLPVTAWPRNLVPGNLYFLNILNPDLYRRYIHVNHKCRLEVLLSPIATSQLQYIGKRRPL